jgi:hypothetical protein
MPEQLAQFYMFPRSPVTLYNTIRKALGQNFLMYLEAPLHYAFFFKIKIKWPNILFSFLSHDTRKI